jgi:hypothetical protein
MVYLAVDRYVRPVVFTLVSQPPPKRRGNQTSCETPQIIDSSIAANSPQADLSHLTANHHPLAFT